MQYSLSWQRDGNDWPNRDASRFVRAAGMLWHVQLLGQGPTLLLLHGIGASSHSYGALAQILARDFTVVVPDLPGHGFTQTPPREFLSLPGMSRAISALLRELHLEPQIAIGHSAGAAVVIHMTIARLIAPRAIVSVNGALLPFSGLAGQMFAPLAKLLVRVPFVSDIFARRARDPEAIRRLIDQTGSKLDSKGVELYRRLAGSPDHVEAALGMMANWDLRRFATELRRLKVPLTLLAGSNDRTISPETANRVRGILPGSEIVVLEGLGHLAHEERPHEVAAVLRSTAIVAGVLPPEGC